MTARDRRLLAAIGRLIWIPAAKTAAGKRVLAVPEEVRGYLLAAARGRDPETPLPGRHWRDWPREWVQRICARAGVPRVTAHGMRGLAATLASVAAITGGTGLGAVAASLGHESPTTTLTSYADPTAVEGATRAGGLRLLYGGTRAPK